MKRRAYRPDLDDAALHRCELDFDGEAQAFAGSLRGKTLACRVEGFKSFHRYELWDCARPADVLLDLDALGLLVGRAKGEAEEERRRRERRANPSRERAA